MIALGKKTVHFKIFVDGKYLRSSTRLHYVHQRADGERGLRYNGKWRSVITMTGGQYACHIHIKTPVMS